MKNIIDERVQCNKCNVWWENKEAVICYMCDKPIDFKSKEINCITSYQSGIENRHLCSFKCLGKYEFEEHKVFKLISLRNCAICKEIFWINKYYLEKLVALNIYKPKLCCDCFEAGMDDIIHNSQIYMESRVRELTKDKEKAVQELKYATYRLTHPEDDE